MALGVAWIAGPISRPKSYFQVKQLQCFCTHFFLFAQFYLFLKRPASGDVIEATFFAHKRDYIRGFLLISQLFALQIKLCGICCLASAVLCVVVTVTTTVIHMNRLQTLRECVYQGSIQTCTCFAGFFDPTMSHHDGNNNNWTLSLQQGRAGP